jgi:predicted transcriptional regulator
MSQGINIMDNSRTIAQKHAYKLLSGLLPGSSDLWGEAKQIAEQAILEVENLPTPEKTNTRYMISRVVHRLVNEYYATSYREERRVIISSSECATNIANILGIELSGKEFIINISRIQRKDINRVLWTYDYNASIMSSTITVHAYPGGMVIKGRIRAYAKYYYEYNDSIVESHSYSQWKSQDETNCELMAGSNSDLLMMLQLIQSLMHLSMEHRHILYHVYGLWGCEKLTVDELAVKLGMTSRNIRYYLDEALNILRKTMPSDDNKGDLMDSRDNEKRQDLLNFIRDLTEKHQLEMNALKARIAQLEKENEQLKKNKTPTDLLIQKGLAPFIQFSFQHIEQLMSEMDDEFKAKLVKSLDLVTDRFQ